MSKSGRKFDLVMYGATGFTGKLTAKYLATHAPKELKWALAGRQKSKLAEIQTLIGETNQHFANLPLVIVNADDPKSLDEMTASTSVVCTTVGPYALYGTPLVASCAKNGTHYCDLTGETYWIRTVIEKYQDEAKKNGAKIVNCCGFDSIPFDLGSYMAASYLWTNYGEKCKYAKVFNAKTNGGISGGTLYSAVLAMQAEAKRPTGPHSLDATPATLHLKRKEETDFPFATFDPDRKRYLGPSIMASVNTKIVRRSKSLYESESALVGSNPYDKDFWMIEAQELKGYIHAILYCTILMSVAGLFALLANFSLGRKVLNKILPAPGQGPSEETMKNGYYVGNVIACSTTDRKVTGVVKCQYDPGYMCTALMLGETALCLALDQEKLPAVYGILTPASAMGKILIERLKKAGMTFEMNSEEKK